MARFVFFLILLGGPLVAQYTTINNLQVPLEVQQGILRPVDILSGSEEVWLIATDPGTERQQHLFRAQKTCIAGWQCWEEIRLLTNERFFSTRPAWWGLLGVPWAPWSLNRVSQDGKNLILKGWDYCSIPSQCGGIYILKGNTLSMVTRPGANSLIRNTSEVTFGQLGVANPGPNGSLVFRANTSAGSFLLRYTPGEIGFGLLANLGRDTQTDGIGGMYDSPDDLVRGIFFRRDIIGNTGRIGLVSAGALTEFGQANGVASYDVKSGVRFGTSNGEVLRFTDMANIALVGDGFLSTTISKFMIPYIAQKNNGDVWNAFDRQRLLVIDPRSGETLVAPVAISPASVYGCTAIIPIFQEGLRTDLNTLNRLVVIRREDDGCN